MFKNLKNYEFKFSPDITNVLAMFCSYGDQDRMERIVGRISKLTEAKVQEILDQIFLDFNDRHIDFEQILSNHAEKIAQKTSGIKKFSSARRLLTGAYFTNEYAYAAAAFMNPSLIVFDRNKPDADGGHKAIMSIRAVGEGHISSIAFRELIIDAGYITPKSEKKHKSVVPAFLSRTTSSSTIKFDTRTNLSERVIFPVDADERNGMEDARFVAFEDGRYFATYTAYDGRNIRVKLLETSDFETFILHRLEGEGIRNKGLALFPHKLSGKYAMIGRLDGENLYFLESDDIFCWNRYTLIETPFEPWELIQIGNCGSPLATEAGWLLLTHGVGAMRSYYLSAYLLDRDEPWKICGRLREPLISPFKTSREGYVPNVVYSCGGAIVNGILYLPYAVADYYVTITSYSVPEILDKMQPVQ